MNRRVFSSHEFWKNKKLKVNNAVNFAHKYGKINCSFLSKNTLWVYLN